MKPIFEQANLKQEFIDFNCHSIDPKLRTQLVMKYLNKGYCQAKYANCKQVEKLVGWAYAVLKYKAPP
jgi:hypothetical protein